MEIKTSANKQFGKRADFRLSLTFVLRLSQKPLGFCDKNCKFATTSGFAYGSA